MISCLNPDCLHSENADEATVCENCGDILVLRPDRYRLRRKMPPIADSRGNVSYYLAEDMEKPGGNCLVEVLTLPMRSNRVESLRSELEQVAQAVKKLSEHPQIISLRDYFAETVGEGLASWMRFYLVWEWMEGETLAQELALLGTFSSTQVEKVLLELLPTVNFLHQQNVLHLDIKPATIVRRRGQGLLLMVNGLISRKLAAAASGAGELLSRGAGELLSRGALEQGSRGALEQGQSPSLPVSQSPSLPVPTVGANGHSPLHPPRHPVTPSPRHPLPPSIASDLYALGETCWELLAGIPPFQLWKVQGGSWVHSWREYLRQPASSELGRVLDKLLAPNHQERYQSAAEVLADFSPQLGPELPSLPAIVPWQPPDHVQEKKRGFQDKRGKWFGKRWKRGMLVGTGAIVLGLAGYGVWSVVVPKPVAYDRLTLTETLAKTSTSVLQLAFTRDGKTLVAANADGKVTILPGTGDKVQTFTAHKAAVNALTLTPDGKTLISASADKAIALWQLGDTKPQATLSGHTFSVFALALTPDGKTLVSGSSDKTIKIWDLKSAKLKTTLTGHQGWVRALAITPDGKTLVSGSQDKTIKIWDLDSGKLKATLKEHQGGILSLAITPDGKTLVSSDQSGLILTWNLPKSKLIQTLARNSTWFRSLTISPDGRTLLAGGGDKTIKIWDLSDGQLQKTLTGHQKGVTALTLSPNGKTLVSASEDGEVKMWGVIGD
ncbi:WD40 repeat domain-containing serine/threonine-protein kinase [[Phormidium] sp. ETS-05]|uniref:WD40 repeat domain-containing serine/threonine-protein kinase n=1 Tax=[Phormidium] sp. ETS-05 TaxID=222819 RepID=UPI0018EF1DA8|nr:WD40 repeat domain-containing serine/threonine-protein kinase [[Phormidium] sp. ETS-05]